MITKTKFVSEFRRASGKGVSNKAATVLMQTCEAELRAVFQLAGQMTELKKHMIVSEDDALLAWKVRKGQETQVIMPAPTRKFYVSPKKKSEKTPVARTVITKAKPKPATNIESEPTAPPSSVVEPEPVITPNPEPIAVNPTAPSTPEPIQIPAPSASDGRAAAAGLPKGENPKDSLSLSNSVVSQPNPQPRQVVKPLQKLTNALISSRNMLRKMGVTVRSRP